MPYVLFTRPRQETRAQKNLGRQGYPTFLPLCRKHPTAEVSPLFPRYLFFWVPEEKPWGPVAGTPGVSKILKHSDFQPSFVMESVIDGIRARMACDGGAIVLEKGPTKRTFTSGQSINVIGGTHAGFSGLYVSQRKDRITALFMMFGRQIKATVLENNIGS